MRNFIHRSCLSIWIACFAILLNALAPSISHALAASGAQAPSLLEICSVLGTRSVAPEQNAGTPQPADGHHAADAAEHCPFCLTHADNPGLPPAALPGFERGDGRSAMPRLFYQAPQPLFSWSAASSRGPPAL